eukprot:COSAG01_NODE_19997_length_977_cov_0.964692_1_plen_57_part_10
MGLSFTVGGGASCRNVTTTTMDTSGAHVQTTTSCLFDGQHEINHTVSADHNIEVTST